MSPAVGWVPTPRGGCPTTGRWRRIAAWTVVLGAILLLAAVAVPTPVAGGVGGGQFQADNDTQAPSLADGHAVNHTAMAVTFTDDVDVDEDSIDASDFVLEHGTVSNVTVVENGRNATATIHLASRINRDSNLVGLDGSSDVSDTSGNVLDASDDFVGVTITGMDGIPPGVVSFDAEPSPGGDVRVSLTSSEPVAGINVTISGPTDVRLDRADFAEAGDALTYESTVTLDADGNYTAFVENVTDEAGNVRQTSTFVQFAVDATPPTAVASIDLTSSADREYAFDASRSHDENGIARLTWAFPDGTNVTGEHATHRFAPGNHTVRLVAVDTSGNVDVDELVLALGGENVTGNRSASPAVAIRRGGNGSRSAMVEVRAASTDEPVAIGAVRSGDAPLALGDGFAIDGLRVGHETNASYELAVGTAGPETVADLATATDATPLGGLTVLHGLADSSVANATLLVSVEQATLSAADATPDSVTVYRFQNGSWSPLPTEQVTNETADRIRYRAHSPGLSRFAIAVERETPETNNDSNTDDEGDDIVVTAASLQTTSVRPGTPVGVEATVANRGGETRTVRLELSVGGPTVETETVEVPGGLSRTVTFHHDVSEPGTYPVSVNGTIAGTVTVQGATEAPEEGSAGFLGFLPLGLVRTLGLYVGVPLLAVYLALKSLAIYLGY